MNAKTLKQVLVVLFCVFTINVLEAQTPWKKELQTESDGFQWYKYSYEKNSNGYWPEAAFDLNGKRLTPTTEHLIHYRDGFFEVWTRDDAEGHHVSAIYDKYGNCIIPDKFGFTSISILSDKGLIICSSSLIHKNGYLGEYYAFSLDGKYYVDEFWADFDTKKKPVSALSGGTYVSNTSSSNSSSSYSSSSTSSSNGESNLLYEGEYTIQYSQSRDLINGYSTGQYSSDETERVKIYEDHLAIHFGTHCKYKSTNSSGERVYEGAQSIGGTVTAYVSPSYNIRLVNESWFNGVHMKVGIPVVKGRSLMPEYSGGYGGGTSSGYQPTNNNNGSTGTSGGSKHGSYVKEETCPACHGTKTCETCLGRGWRNNPFTNQHDTCPICRGRKTCQTCNGSGKVSKTVYY